jgi:hypothetical protein
LRAAIRARWVRWEGESGGFFGAANRGALLGSTRLASTGNRIVNYIGLSGMLSDGCGVKADSSSGFY